MPSSINIQGSKVSIEVEVKNFLLGVKSFADAAGKQSKAVEAYAKAVKSFGKAAGSFGKAQGQQQKFLSGVLDLLKRMQQAGAKQAPPSGAAAARKLFDDRRGELFKENLQGSFPSDEERLAALDGQLRGLKEKTGLQAEYAERLQAVIDLEKQRAVLEKNSLASAQAAFRARTAELRAANDAVKVERIRRGDKPEKIDEKRNKISEKLEKPGKELKDLTDELVRNFQADLLAQIQVLKRREEGLRARARELEASDPAAARELSDQADDLTRQAGGLEKARASGRDSIADQLPDQVVEQKLRNHIELMQNSMKVFRDLSAGAATILTEGLAEAVAKADNLKDAFKDIGRQLLKLALQKLVIDQAKGLLSNALGGLFGGGKAAGGPVQAGRLYMVGERGRELFRPQVPGEIVPNYKMRPALAGAGGNAFNFSINIQSSDGPGVRAALAEAVPVIEARVSRAVKGEVQADLARPSALRGAARG